MICYCEVWQPRNQWSWSSCSEEKSLMVRFPDPKQYLLLQQLEEWNIIVSCDQLGDTLAAAPTCNQCASSCQLHFHFFFFFIFLWALIIEVYLLANVFFKDDKVRFTTQAIQIDLVPSRLRQLTGVTTGFAVPRVTRVTGASKRTFCIRASSWRMAIMGTCCAFVYVRKNKYNDNYTFIKPGETPYSHSCSWPFIVIQKAKY